VQVAKASPELFTAMSTLCAHLQAGTVFDLPLAHEVSPDMEVAPQ
jgi:hypothetical protein